MQETINIKNKRAYFEYEALDKFNAGIQLTGTEIKSVRASKVSMNDAWCFFVKDELFIKNLHIAEYEKGNIYNHDPLRVRKLLLHRRELHKLQTKIKEKGLTIIPFRFFINERGLAKLEIALARGKKVYDKRETIKERAAKRDLNRELKNYR
jgi:SsrA-binding protein